LVYMLRRPVAMGPAYEEAGGIEPTRPVTADEMKQVSPELTIEVPSIPAQLEMLSGPSKGEKYILKKQNIIGRETGDLTLSDPTVSAEHAQITFKNKKYILSNKSLTNPTKVNKAAVEGLQELNDGDEIVMGAVKLKFTML
jgi:pSer/pThr/pTyr-binding forkhead associated (FHA) protein